MSLPLEGVTVVDLTRILAGPFCTQRLGDLGADVIKIERTDGGDDTRGWGPPFAEGVSTYFLSVNRNKRSVALDLKQEGGKALLWRLLADADVVVENFRPGTLERLGFGWDAMRARCPRLVYCSISGYGHHGNNREHASYDVIVQGESGAMDLTGEQDGAPTKCGLSIADEIAGHNAVEGIMAALLRRGRTGEGGRVDVALFDGMLALLTYQGQMLLSCDRDPVRLGNAHPSIVPYQTFQARDGWINIGVGSESLWARFCDAMERPDWAGDPRFRTNKDRVVHRAELIPQISEALVVAPAAHWYDRLRRAGVPCGLVRTVRQALDMARDDTRDMVVPLEHPEVGRLDMVGCPVRLDAAPIPRTPPPRLGEHTDAVLREHGVGDAELSSLREAGVIA
jgi:crotonobetainyl-CoA:carnitine CoA-transferase CaiB-like acyl-CoA transferase